MDIKTKMSKLKIKNIKNNPYILGIILSPIIGGISAFVAVMQLQFSEPYVDNNILFLIIGLLITVICRGKKREGSYLIIGILMISLYFLYLPFKYPSEWREYREYMRDLNSLILYIVMGLAVLFKTQKLISNYLKQSDIHIVPFRVIEYIYKYILVAEIMGILTYILTSRNIMFPAIPVFPPIGVTFMVIAFSASEAREVVLVGSIFQMLIQLMIVYEFFKAGINKIEIKQLRRYLLVPSIVILIQGWVAIIFSSRRCLEGRDFQDSIYIHAGILEYGLMVFVLISSIIFLIRTKRLYMNRYKDI